MTIMLQDAAIKRIVDKLAAEYAPQRIILFGSYAEGHPGSDSDVDLLIVKDTQERFIDRWTTVRRILADRERKLPIDTLVMTPGEVADRLAAGDQFVAKIIREGRVLYDA
ncbi:MAG: nucleotidyltransferase domain-containing protein [Armatimonadota bacterium]